MVRLFTYLFQLRLLSVDKHLLGKEKMISAEKHLLKKEKVDISQKHLLNNQTNLLRE